MQRCEHCKLSLKEIIPSAPFAVVLFRVRKSRGRSIPLDPYYISGI